MIPHAVRWLALAATLPLVLAAQPPALDLSFAPEPNGDVHALAAQPDGKTLVGGGFSRIGGAARSNFARLNADGSVDASFNPIFSSRGGNGPGVVLVEAYDTGVGTAARLMNISALNQVGTGGDILIAGFSITGYGTMRVLIRVVGPTLALPPFGVAGALADPNLELYQQGGALLGENDNWDPAIAATFPTVGAFPLAPGSKDAALIATLNAGTSYTVHAKGTTGGTGVGLIEVYELP